MTSETFFRAMSHAKVLIDRKLFNQICDKVQVDEKRNIISGILRAPLVTSDNERKRKRLLN